MRRRSTTRTLPASSGPPIEVGLVQGNVDVGTQWSEDFYGMKDAQKDLGLDASISTKGDDE